MSETNIVYINYVLIKKWSKNVKNEAERMEYYKSFNIGDCCSLKAVTKSQSNHAGERPSSSLTALSSLKKKIYVPHICQNLSFLKFSWQANTKEILVHLTMI